MGKDENDPNPGSAITETVIALCQDMAAVKTDIKWLKAQMNSADRKLWAIITGIIISLLINIVFWLAKYL